MEAFNKEPRFTRLDPDLDLQIKDLENYSGWIL